MTGPNRQSAMILQPRDRDLLRTVGTLRILSREDAQALAGFRSVTRANARLLQLTTAGLLTRRPYGTRLGGQRYLYALTRAGARAADLPFRPPLWSAHATLAWSPTLEHQLLITRVYRDLHAWVHEAADARQLVVWRTFERPVSPAVTLIPDAYIRLTASGADRSVFLEADRGTETRVVWARKVRAYLQLAQSGEFTRRFQQPQFRVAVVVPSARRLHSIRQVIAQQTAKLFWLTAVETRYVVPLFASPWWRPTGDDRQPVL